MAGFLYYVPGRRASLSLSDMVDAGLGYAFDVAPSCADVTGPDGVRGVVCVAGDRPNAPPIGYSDKGQTWRKVPSKDVPLAWVGMVASLPPPTPLDLQRPSGLPGFDVTLANDTTWSVPFARRYIDTADGIGSFDCVPRVVDLDDSGQVIEGEHVAKHRGLWDVSEAYVAHTSDVLSTPENEPPPVMDQQKLFVDAAAAISVNYYISLVELVCLKAIDRDSAENVLRAVIDWDTFVDLVNKKKHSEPLSTDNGNEGSPQATPQLSAT